MQPIVASRRRVAAAHAVLVCLGAAAVGATSTARAPAQSPAGQSPPGAVFEVATIDGRVLTGSMTAAQGRLRIAPAAGAPAEVAIADLVGVRRVGAGQPAQANAAAKCVWLRSGAVLPATSIEGVAATDAKAALWIVNTVGGAHLEVPQAHVAAARLRAIPPETFAADRAAPDQNSDYLYVVKDGKPQRFRVTIASLHDGNVHFDLGGKLYEFPLGGVDGTAAVVFGTNTGFAPDRQPKPRVAATLTTGERCEGRLESIDATLALALDEGMPFVVPIDRLYALEVATDKMLWLGSLQPRVDQTAAFDRTWPWTVDSSPVGPGIRLAGRRYDHGLVLVPRTRLTFDLGGRYDMFEATIGIDERGGPQADAVLRVFGDGRLLFESSSVQLASPPQQVRVELDRCRELAIEADFGRNFDLGDLCAFADARVVQH